MHWAASNNNLSDLELIQHIVKIIEYLSSFYHSVPLPQVFVASMFKNHKMAAGAPAIMFMFQARRWVGQGAKDLSPSWTNNS